MDGQDALEKKEVGKQVDILRTGLDGIGKRVDKLRSAILPILSQAPNVASEKERAVEGLCPLATDLRKLNEQAEKIYIALFDIKDSVEL